MEDIELNNEDLSITLLERRKRLHELANEINNWEDESTKNSNLLENQQTNRLTSLIPQAPILSFEPVFNRSTTTNSYYSPKHYQMNNRSPMVNKNNTSPYNKENHNSSPAKRKYAENKTSTSSITASSSSIISTSSSILSNSEILNAAHRILNKHQSNSSVSNKTSGSNISETSICNINSVKNMKSKFEPNNADQTDNTFIMTPKSIIKKFEQMTREGTSLNGGCTTASSGTISTQSSASNLNSNKTEKIQNQILTEKPVASIYPKLKPIQQEETMKKSIESNNIYSEHIHPKSIIQKFEQLVKNNTCASNNFNNQEQISTMSKSISNGSSFTNENRCSNSLTYISSAVSEDDHNFENNETFKNDNSDFSEDEIYEELGNNNREETIAKDNNSLSENTSLFEDEITTTNTQNTNEETYSISSSYSGSIINKEFDDIENNEESEEEINSDIYSCYDDDVTSSYEQSNYQSQESSEDLVKEKISFSSALLNLNAPSESVLSSITEETNTSEEQQSEPLFSIKEYRKQKKNGGYHRRSSIAKCKESKSKASYPSNKSNVNNPVATSSLDDINIKKSKYLERIKELEEFIKQENNHIHQSGIALERCLTDTLFTGSSEHIECNRILLISCQKRQAYSSEISRLKQLISILAKKPVQQVQPTTIDEYSGISESPTELSPTDLTGLLIFSDLQLPIKESYLNKLKSGDEKRIFYFLCLIRNGIQVLQTQVISVQELIATRDTSIIFTNRMAINNVDVNFKVKIDIYTLEITPKEIKHNKSTSLASNATSKFFSPFKNSVFYPHHSSTSNQNSAANNHHYNEQSTLGISSGGAKTSNFIHIDTVEITNKDLSSNRFKLNISSSSIPLTGVLFMTVRCMPSKSIELKGFMTLLEDVNGFRSWDRRWCFLNNYNISFWKYPEDEYKNSPLGIINLTKCTNEKVSILPRDICARKYTFELVVNELDSTEIDQEDKNKQKRYRLSADNKDQANDWLTNVNYALANLKLWNPKTNKTIVKK